MQPDPSWTTGPACAAPDEGLHQTVAGIAAARPDAVALLAAGRAITYAELDRDANGWAAGLAAAGVGPGDLVPVLLPRCAELVTALLAVLKTGAGYALLDPSWPVPRLREVAGELGATVLVTDDRVDARPNLPVWSPPAGPAGGGRGYRPVAVPGDAPCCVFFTSGTTGRPKGVLSPHRATARLFQPGSFARFGPGSAVALAAALPWDAFSLELWSALLTGGTSVIIDEPYLTARALRACGADTVWLTSSLFNMVVDEDLDAFAGRRQVMIGGERLSTPHVHRFLRRHPAILLLNGYGPVESTVFATTHRITEADCAAPGGIPLGTPVPGTRVHVLDCERPCGVGEVGEICLAGDGLALGYLGDPALTESRFPRLRLAGVDVRVYRTGDLGAWGRDGLLRFHGRADRQVKIRGHRIEPADIECRLRRSPRVRSAHVVARRDGDGDGDGAAVDLVAFCVPRTPGDPLAGLLAHLRSALPAHQRPVAVVSVDAFPVTAQGKLDERALLALAPAASETAAGGDAPQPPPDDLATRDPLTGDPAVRLVAEVYREVLGRASIPLDVPFTDLGGTSLGAGRVCARLAARLDRPVRLSDLDEHGSVAALARWLGDTAVRVQPPARAVPSSGSPAPEDGAETDLPLTAMQLVYLSKRLAEPADRTAHCLLTWVIDGEPDLERLESAIALAHRRHPPLRTAYLADPRPVARLVDLEPPPLEVLPDQPSVDAALSALRALLAEELDPTEGDVWRAALAPVRPGDAATAADAASGGGAVFGCVVHHIAFDGWSEAVLANDLAAGYDGRQPAGTVPAPHAVHRDQLRRVTAARRHLEPLAARLAGVPQLRWPPGPTPPGPTSPGPTSPGPTSPGPAATGVVPAGQPGLVEVRLPVAVIAGVDAQAAEAGTTRFVALLAH